MPEEPLGPRHGEVLGGLLGAAQSGAPIRRLAGTCAKQGRSWCLTQSALCPDTFWCWPNASVGSHFPPSPSVGSPFTPCSSVGCPLWTGSGEGDVPLPCIPWADSRAPLCPCPSHWLPKEVRCWTSLKSILTHLHSRKYPVFQSNLFQNRILETLVLQKLSTPFLCNRQRKAFWTAAYPLPLWAFVMWSIVFKSLRAPSVETYCSSVFARVFAWFYDREVALGKRPSACARQITVWEMWIRWPLCQHHSQILVRDT